MIINHTTEGCCWEDRPEGDITNNDRGDDDVRQHQRRSVIYNHQD